MDVQRTREPDAIDCWMRSALVQQYAEILQEPLPDTLLDLLRDLDA